jgi:hypothetical protein
LHFGDKDICEDGDNSLNVESNLDEFEVNSAITSLFSRVTAFAIVVLIVLIYIRGIHGSKDWDWAAFIVSLLGAVLFGVRFLLRPMTSPNRLVIVISAVGIYFGIASVERPMTTDQNWQGFGISVALLSLLVSFLIVPVATRLIIQTPTRNILKIQMFLTGIMSIVALAVATSFVRDLSDFAYPANNTYVLNEILAPAAGRVPASNYVPQYTSLLGWIIVPLRHLMTWRFQPISATSSASFSSGIIYPSVSRGRPLRLR